MMINTDLVKEGVAVRCNSLEEAEELFEAMGWNPKEYYHFPEYGFNCNPTYYTFGTKHTWDSMKEPYNRKSMDFSDLKQSRLASILGVKDGQRFKYQNSQTTYWVERGELKCNFLEVSIEELYKIINNPDKIKPIKKYRQETIEDAKAAIRLLYDTVAVYDYYIYLVNENDCENSIYIPKESGLFKDLPIEKSIKLKDIIANEQ